MNQSIGGVVLYVLLSHSTPFSPNLTFCRFPPIWGNSNTRFLWDTWSQLSVSFWAARFQGSGTHSVEYAILALLRPWAYKFLKIALIDGRRTNAHLDDTPLLGSALLEYQPHDFTRIPQHLHQVIIPHRKGGVMKHIYSHVHFNPAPYLITSNTRSFWNKRHPRRGSNKHHTAYIIKLNKDKKPETDPWSVSCSDDATLNTNVRQRNIR